jgi:hypothetical protein
LIGSATSDREPLSMPLAFRRRSIRPPLSRGVSPRSRGGFRNDDEYLFSSRANAERLLQAYHESFGAKAPFTLQELRARFGLE